jgi:hypothetical protein
MAESLSRWRWGVTGGLAALTIALGCSQSGTTKTPEAHRAPPLEGASARTSVASGTSQVGAERGTMMQVSPQEAEQIAANAYIYAYPLMVMAVTKDVMTATPRPDTKALKAPINQVVSATAFPDPKFGEVVRPNFDTLYTSAWMDLAAEPLVLSVPDMGERYYLLPMLDAWTNVFAVPGSRTTGNDASEYVITGPTFQGTVPKGMRQVKAPTRYVWLIGRIATKPGADEKVVRELESQIRLAPLSRHGDRSMRTLATSVSQSVDTKTKPPVQVARMTPQQFFGRFTELTRDNPPAAADQPIVASFSKLGIVPGKAFDIGSLSPELQNAVARGMASGQKAIEGKIREVDARRGWVTLGNDLGQYGTDYTNRAVVALGGLGANLTADAVYPTAGTDSQGRPLDGTHKYLIRFREAPPAQAFWSLTVYDQNGYVVKNPIDRYSIGSQYPLSKGADGSTVILLQPGEPQDAKERSNWLPTPQGKKFNVMLRLYQPEQNVQDGTWKAPAIERVD